jgi:hypothetical protein
VCVCARACVSDHPTGQLQNTCTQAHERPTKTHQPPHYTTDQHHTHPINQPTTAPQNHHNHGPKTQTAPSILQASAFSGRCCTSASKAKAARRNSPRSKRPILVVVGFVRGERFVLFGQIGLGWSVWESFGVERSIEKMACRMNTRTRPHTSPKHRRAQTD